MNSNYKNFKLSENYGSETYNEFIKNYNKLRDEFNNKKLNRGQFGEGLWTNLLSYLKSIEEKLK